MLGYDDGRAKEFYDRALERVRAIPGVESAALAERLPFSINYNRNNVFLPDRHGPDDKGVVIDVARVSPEYFATLGVPIVQGRNFAPPTRRPRRASPSSTRRWRGSTGRIRTPIGKRFRVHDLQRPRGRSRRRDGRLQGQHGRRRRDAVRALRRLAAAEQRRGDHRADARRRRRAARARCAASCWRSSRTSSSSTTRRWRRRWRRRCCRRGSGAIGVSAVGIVAMVLASIGLYGVIAYSVARRTREIGIRMALGAKPSAVVGLVMRQGLGIAAVGVGGRRAAGARRGEGGRRRAVRRQLRRSDRVGRARSSTLFVVVGAGELVPARRASVVDPSSALRSVVIVSSSDTGRPRSSPARP